MKQMEVTIMGQSYLLGCPEGGEAALTKAVARVDKEMCAIRDAGRIKARERIEAVRMAPHGIAHPRPGQQQGPTVRMDLLVPPGGARRHRSCAPFAAAPSWPMRTHLL